MKQSKLEQLKKEFDEYLVKRGVKKPGDEDTDEIKALWAFFSSKFQEVEKEAKVEGAEEYYKFCYIAPDPKYINILSFSLMSLMEGKLKEYLSQLNSSGGKE